MTKENKTTSIQEQRFKIDLFMRGIDVSQAAEAIAGYMPGSKINEVEDGSKLVVDHLERQWLVSLLEDDGNEARIFVSSPKLAYEDLDELLYLVGELKEKGALGGEGCGMRFFACMEGQTAAAIQNLRNIVTGKSVLLGKAIQHPFTVQVERMNPDVDGCVELVPCEMAVDLNLGEIKACILLGCAISAQAISQNRASAEVLRPENEKYAFRCWLIRMNLKGDEYKPMRMRFLKRFDGDASYKGGREAVA